MQLQSLILLVHSPDAPGIVARISNLIFETQGNITQLDQHTTTSEEGQFFMRVRFDLPRENFTSFEEKWQALSRAINAKWQLFDIEKPQQMAILVSKADHCLYDLLYRYASRELIVDIPFIISNHRDLEAVAEKYNIPFVHIPIAKETKKEAERELLKQVHEKSDFMVLARYMQILSPEFIETYGKAIINIHHSFLPSFKGAYPYERAYERGVKLIGATAHFVTHELDEGPIIEQMVMRVSHRDSADDMRRMGKNIEKLALASAVRCYVERRIIRYENRTVVFT
ncbi:MAG TPA: formyltetrahydrofolate deformylase [Turneriella sp.]|nr:formyltetrahydrofolate deformylase [Turneriella sp.]